MSHRIPFVSSGTEPAPIAVGPSLDATVAPSLRDVVVRRIAKGESITLDMAAVSFIDAAGVGVLAGCDHRARAEGVPLNLINVPKRLMEVLTLTALDLRLQISSCAVPRAARSTTEDAGTPVAA